MTGPPTLTVLRAGPGSTVQDLGRPGYAHLGVPASGAADPGALRRANRLVGNPDDAAGVETTLLGVSVRFDAPGWAAVAGAPCPVRLDGRPVGPGPFPVPSGGVLDLGRATLGVRSYLAVAGGLAVPPVLGSRSTDLLSGLGPAPLAAGQVLPVGPSAGRPAATPGAGDATTAAAHRRDDGRRADHRRADDERADHRRAADDWPSVGRPARPGLLPGPRYDWFSGPARHLLGTATWRVAPASDRIGVRLTGPPVPAATTASLPSEGMVRGSVQVPPGGQPIVFLADHPTTGGYPVIGVVDPADLWLLAQARPGVPVRFAWRDG